MQELPADPFEASPKRPERTCLKVALVVLIFSGCGFCSVFGALAFQYPVRRSLATFDSQIVLRFEDPTAAPEEVRRVLRTRFRRLGTIVRIQSIAGEVEIDFLNEDRERVLATATRRGEVLLFAEAGSTLGVAAKDAELARIQAAQEQGTWDLAQDRYARFPWSSKLESPPADLLLASAGRLEGSDFASFSRALDADGRVALGFKMSPQGTKKLFALTSANIGRQLVVVVDGEVVSAPVIRAAISKRGIIAGAFSEFELAELRATLSAGALPTGLSLKTERSLGR